MPRVKKLPIPKAADELRIKFDFYVKGKGRPRFGNGVVYMHPDYVTNKSEVATVLRQCLELNIGFMQAERMYSLYFHFNRKRRKPKSKADAAWMDRHWPIGGVCRGKPDVDNVIGTVMDAANLILWHDDSDVVHAEVTRRWGTEDGAYLRIIKHEDYDVCS